MSKKMLAPPTFRQLPASSYLSSSAPNSALDTLPTPLKLHSSNLASLCSPVTETLSRPLNSHLSPWITVFICLSPPFGTSPIDSYKYRQPNTLGWPFMDCPVPPLDATTRPVPYDSLRLLGLLPNFMPLSVQEHLSAYRDASQPLVYSFEAFSHLLANGIRPGTNSSDMDLPYDWPLDWDLPATPATIFTPFQVTHPDAVPLLWSLGGHFLKRLITALLSPNGHFPALLLSTMWGLQCGHTSLCVQGIFWVWQNLQRLPAPCTYLRCPSTPLCAHRWTKSPISYGCRHKVGRLLEEGLQPAPGIPLGEKGVEGLPSWQGKSYLPWELRRR